MLVAGVFGGRLDAVGTRWVPYSWSTSCAHRRKLRGGRKRDPRTRRVGMVPPNKIETLSSLKLAISGPALRHLPCIRHRDQLCMRHSGLSTAARGSKQADSWEGTTSSSLLQRRLPKLFFQRNRRHLLASGYADSQMVKAENQIEPSHLASRL